MDFLFVLDKNGSIVTIEVEDSVWEEGDVKVPVVVGWWLK